MLLNIPAIISNFLKVDISDVKKRLQVLSLSELVDLLQYIRDDNYDGAFKIYSGSAVWNSKKLSVVYMLACQLETNSSLIVW